MSGSDGHAGGMSTTMSTMRRFFAAEADYLTHGGSFAAMAECLAPDFVLYQAAHLPYGGEWHGADGFQRFMAAMREAWSSLEFFGQRFVVDGDTVVAHVEGRLRSRATGKALDTSLLMLLTFRDGLVTECRPYYLDTVAVLDALGLNSVVTDMSPA